MSDDATDRLELFPPHTLRMVSLLAALLVVPSLSQAWADRILVQWRQSHPRGSEPREVDRAKPLEPPAIACTIAFALAALFVLVEVLLRRWSPWWLLFAPAYMIAWFLTFVSIDLMTDSFCFRGQR